MKKQAVTPIPSQAVERYASTAQAGLTRAQAAARAAQHLDNRAQSARTKSISCIVRDNVCTLFNLINLVLAVAILAVGSYKNAMFIGVVLCNMAIGIIQEVRAKRTVDKLSLMSAVKAHVVREGACMDIAREDVVLDDVLALKSGGEVAADALVLEGACDVNESFVTGEADAVHKKAGDTLLAGSFVVSGTCRARVEHVGNDTYIAGISRDAKRLRMATSEIMGTLKKIIKIISIVIIPVGAILLWNQLTMSHNSIQDAVVQTAAALIGMIPEGLMLLTSTVLAVSVVRLSKHKVLVQELYCIENLARVDTLCLDKTGTLTEGVMEVSEVLPLAGQSQSACMRALAALACACSDKNATMQAIAQRVGQQSDWSCQLEVPFSSDTKWSGAVFAGRGSYVLGAPEFVLGDMPDALRALVNPVSYTHLDVYKRQTHIRFAPGTWTCLKRSRQDGLVWCRGKSCGGHAGGRDACGAIWRAVRAGHCRVSWQGGRCAGAAAAGVADMGGKAHKKAMRPFVWPHCFSFFMQYIPVICPPAGTRFWPGPQIRQPRWSHR